MMQTSGSTAKFAELGSLISQSNDESQFVGSSSGVFFVNTVRQAFAKSFSDPSTASTPKFPAAEDTVVGSTESISVGDQASASLGHVGGNYQLNWIYDPRIAQNLGEAPDLSTARQLMMVYFKIWHPVFPFLHGPTFLRAMEAFFSRGDTNDTMFHSSSMSEHHRACWTAIFQSVFNMSTFLRPDLELSFESKIKNPVNALNLANVILMRHDILSLQAMLAVQLYLVASMSLRPASLLGGSILRAALHAGFHRCPYRFQQFTTHERQLRKRIFWCVYAIDRYLSQALGLPLGIQDSDTDVCQPGSREIHSPQDPRSSFLKFAHVLERSEGMHDDKLQVDSADNLSGANYGIFLLPNLERNREATLAGFVTYGRLVGRALELFHKSINNREIHQSAVLYLVSDVHKWWNNLSPSLQTVSTQTTQVSEHDSSSSPALGSFFSVLYKHLILCINRPCLSLEPSSADFCSAIQICIDAARSIISLLKAQLTNGEPFFWPNLLSAAYMSGLVIAFACKLRQYSTFKGCQEMRDCLEIMQSMPRQWDIARHCHTALSILLLNIERRSVGDEIPGSKRAIQSDSTYLRGSTTKVKRPRTTDNEAGRSEQSIGNNNEEPSFILNATIDSSAVDSSVHSSSREEEEEEFGEIAATTFFPGMQWLDEPSFVSTNFDLNMTNLFGDSSAWDPMLFEAFDLEYSQDPVR